MDPILIQILRNKIASLVEEMHYHFYRSGYSTIIRESRDFSCVILDRDGRLIVAPPMFFHAPVYRHFTGRMLALYGEDGIRDGDVFVSNHPYEAGMPHVSDMAFIAPVFAGGRDRGVRRLDRAQGRRRRRGAGLDLGDRDRDVPRGPAAAADQDLGTGPAAAGRRAHHPHQQPAAGADARRHPRPDRSDPDGRGARQGAVRALRRRRADRRVCRDPEGRGRRIARGHRQAARGHIAAEGYLDSDGIDVDKPIKLVVAVTVKDGLAHFDFTGCDPQAKGPVNLRPSMVEACVFYSLIGSLGPELAFNDGMRDAVRFTYAPRTIVNAEPPGPVSSYQMVNLLLTDVILDALAQFNPRRAMAHSGASSALSIAWSKGRPGQTTQQYEIAGSSYGGGMGHDGATAVATHLSNLHTTPIEVLESEFPCRIVQFELVPDSGGPGRWRGGLAMQREYELLENATVIRRFNKTRFPPKGVAGGRDGTRARFVVRVGTDKEYETKASARVEMQAGERFLLQSAGAGGYGDPRERDRTALARDITEGYLSKDAAVRDYGANE